MVKKDDGQSTSRESSRDADIDAAMDPDIIHPETSSEETQGNENQG